MADTAPPLTEADPLSEWIARIVFAFPSGDSRRDDIRVLAARALTLESDLAQLRAFIGHVADGGSIVSTAAMTPTQIAVARAAERMFVTQDGLGFVYVPGPLTASEQDELAQLRREKAERERELDALRAFEDQARNALENGRWEGPAISEGLMLLKAIDEARK